MNNKMRAPMPKAMDKMRDKLAEAMFGMTRSLALEKDICVCCKKAMISMLAVDAQEYRISALCPHCFDVITRSLR